MTEDEIWLKLIAEIGQLENLLYEELQRSNITFRNQTAPIKMNEVGLINFASQLLAAVALFKFSDDDNVIACATRVGELLEHIGIFPQLRKCPKCGGTLFGRHNISATFYWPEPRGIESANFGQKTICINCGAEVAN